MTGGLRVSIFSYRSLVGTAAPPRNPNKEDDEKDEEDERDENAFHAARTTGCQ